MPWGPRTPGRHRSSAWGSPPRDRRRTYHKVCEVAARMHRVERLTRADYFDAALELLADGGVGALTIANLCDRLAVTKGSFYYHFPSIRAFHDAFLEHWETGRAYQLSEQVEAVSDPHDRIELLKRLGVAVHHEAESAIRGWART